MEQDIPYKEEREREREKSKQQEDKRKRYRERKARDEKARGFECEKGESLPLTCTIQDKIVRGWSPHQSLVNRLQQCFPWQHDIDHTHKHPHIQPSEGDAKG